MTFGLTPAGFNAMRLADVKQSLENAFIAQFGDINLDPQSVFGQEIGVLSKSFADLWENLEDVYLSQYPNSASGVSLDNVVALNGITRLPATQTSVTATCAGLEGTYIPVNSIAQISETGDNFYANVGGTITQQNADIVLINVSSLSAQEYIVNLSNQVFISSLPIITFTATSPTFVTGNVITLTINGVVQTPINFTTDSNTTLALISTQITAFNSGLSGTATPSNPNIITIVPNIGFNITINNILITGGASQTAYSISYAAPGSNNDLTAALTAIINAGTPSWIAADGMNGTISITANTPSIPFSTNLGTNLLVTYRASPINFLSENFGPIPCPVGALDTIITPIAGWQSVTNLIAGVTGTLIETDAALRIRRQNSIKLLSAATVDAIEAGLLQKVSGVTSAVVFENRTLTQLPIIITFPAPFQASDVITVDYAAASTFNVNYNTNQATTMANLVSAFELLPEVSSASYGGTGNQTLTVNMVILTDLVVTSVTASISAQTASISGGRPPKSFEAVVQGGSDQAVAEQIWLTKPAGIETFGNVNNGMGITIYDSQGNPQVIFFSRAVELYIWVQVALTLNTQETFPVGGTILVQNAILNYGNSLGVGVSVLFQRVLSQIFTVPGIASGDMTIAATTSLTVSPSYGTNDITITDAQIPVFQLSTIFVTVS